MTRTFEMVFRMKRKRKGEGKKMKKLVGLLVISMFFVFPLCAGAGIIKDVTLLERADWNAAKVSFDGMASTGTYYLDYEVSINGGSFLEAFCVENTDSPPSADDYSLVTLDAVAAKYTAAAKVAQYYFTNYDGAANEMYGKDLAQLAVWEIISDYNTFDLAKGKFRFISGYDRVINAQDVVNFYTNAVGGTGNWVLAVNPTITTPADISLAPYQNYLVQVPQSAPITRVPEPATMILLSMGLLGLGVGFGTRKSKK
jgi:hypothetical protein